jgi:predicted nucleotidyltransferase
MQEQEKIIKCLTAFFRRDSKRIRGAALIGSFGRGQGSSTSDIDIELLLESDKIDIEKFTNDIIELFTQTEESLVVKHTIWLADKRKLAVYHGSQLILTELYLYSRKLTNIFLLKFYHFSSIIPIR